jgi:hypothetical protein
MKIIVRFILMIFLCSIGFGLGSGSDYLGFDQLVGSSNMDATYTFNRVEQGNLASYPLYHTSYETFSMMKKFVDPDFTVSLFLNGLNFAIKEFFV